MGSLFPICNAYHLGAYQVAINEAADLDSTETNNALSSSDAIEKDCYVYRSYIALGSYQVRVKLCFLSLFVRVFRREMTRKSSSRLVLVVAKQRLRRFDDDDDDFRSVFARAVFERINTDVWGKRSPSRFCLA